MRSDFFDKLRNLSFLYESGKIRYDKKVSEERAVLKEDFGQNVRYVWNSGRYGPLDF
jgi:hypothetical protein